MIRWKQVTPGYHEDTGPAFLAKLAVEQNGANQVELASDSLGQEHAHRVEAPFEKVMVSSF
jgi:hypothetical protein